MNFKNGNIAFKPSEAYLAQKNEAIEATLNEWGEEGWEVTHVYTPEGSGKVTLIAKRQLTRETVRQRSIPQYNTQ